MRDSRNLLLGLSTGPLPAWDMVARVSIQMFRLLRTSPPHALAASRAHRLTRSPPHALTARAQLDLVPRAQALVAELKATSVSSRLAAPGALGFGGQGLGMLGGGF